MKNVTATIAHTIDMLARGRRVYRDQRLMASNFRTAARGAGTGPIRVARAARIKPVRMLLAWWGLNIMVSDLFRLMGALGMTSQDVFRGTGEAR